MPRNDNHSAHIRMKTKLHTDEPSKRRFRIALSFSGNVRDFVEKVAEQIAAIFTRNSVLYDKFHEAEFARPDLAFHLPSLYTDESDLIVVAFDESYTEKEWCGLEWNAIYSLIKGKDSSRIMLLRFSNTPPQGLFGLEGSINAVHKSPYGIAQLILERLAINEGKPRDYYSRMSGPIGSSSIFPYNSDPDSQVASAFENELAVIRRDRAGKSRRKTLLDLEYRVIHSRNIGKHIHVVRLMICRTLLAEARYFADYERAVKAIDNTLHEMEAASVAKVDRIDVHTKIADVAVDIAQYAPTGISLNSLVSRLNLAVRQLGRDLCVGKEREARPELLSILLVSRSKCKRALCKLLRLRTGFDKSTKNHIRNFKKESFRDAQEAHQVYPSLVSSFELALSLFLNSGHYTSELSNQGLSILQELYQRSRNTLVGYELVRQCRLRHDFIEAAKTFQVVADSESDILRLHGNLSSFTACVVGMYHCKDTPDLVRTLALKACNWLQDCISAEHHRASEVVDLCYMRAIAGFSIEDITQPLIEFQADSPEAWNVLAQTAYNAAAGETILSDSLLLGLENASIWSRIGTLYADFCDDPNKSLQFYDRAIRLNPHSPIYFFNKARILASSVGDMHTARLALEQCKSRGKNHWGWYKINNKEIKDLERRLIASGSRKSDA